MLLAPAVRSQIARSENHEPETRRGLDLSFAGGPDDQLSHLFYELARRLERRSDLAWPEAQRRAGAMYAKPRLLVCNSALVTSARR
jgi:hypothetical protein